MTSKGSRLGMRAGLGLVGLVAAASVAVLGPAPASAQAECLTGSNDFDRDGTVDVAVGMPGASSRAGAVEVLLSAGGQQRTVRLQAPAARAGDRYGAALAEVASFREDSDQDQCSLLVVGAPGRNVEGHGDAGAVFVYRYDDATQNFALVRELVQGDVNGVPGSPQTGARFGAALAAPYHFGGFADVLTRLYVGAPGAAVGGAAGAGLFVTFRLDDGTAVDAHRVTQGTGAPGIAERGDALGSALADVGDGVLVGTPGENRGAGGFVRWHENPNADNAFYTQNSPGVPGVPEPGDQYGTAIYYGWETDDGDGGTMLLVGAPGEDIGSVRNAGTAHAFRFTGEVDLANVRGFDQNTPGVGGAPEPGDRFGAALGTFANLQPLIGVPGEDIGAVKNAGMVSAVVNNRVWHQNSERMPGTVEAGDRFGATIANARIPFRELDGSWPHAPLIGAPGENGGAGFVVNGVTSAGSPFPVAWVQHNPRPGDRYGAAIGKVN